MSTQENKFEKLPLLSTYRKILTDNFMLPRENEPFFDRRRIVKAVLPLIFGGIPYFMGTIGYLYCAFTRNLWPQQMYSLLYLVQKLAAISVLTIFVCNSKNHVISDDQMSEYEYGAPNGSESIINKINKICFAAFYFVRILCIFQGIFASLFRNYCDDPSFLEETGYICGSYIPLWYPFKMDYPLVKVIIRICVICSSAFYLPIFCISIVSPLTKSYLTLERIRKFAELLRHFNESSRQKIITLRDLIFFIKYHAEITKCISLLNISLGYCHAPMQLLMPIVIALYTYQVYLTYDFFAFAALFLWIGPYFVLCLLGESLHNECSNLSDIAYDIKWYKFEDKKVISSFRLFLQKLSAPVTLKLKPIGALNHMLLIKIVKTAYSCILFFFDSAMK